MNKYAIWTIGSVIGIAFGLIFIVQAAYASIDTASIFTAYDTGNNCLGPYSTDSFVTWRWASDIGSRETGIYTDSSCSSPVGGTSNSRMFQGPQSAGNWYTLTVSFIVPAGYYWKNNASGGYYTVYPFLPDSTGGGSAATSSPYIIDIGSTVMLGGILMFLIAYWIIGLIRSARSK